MKYYYLLITILVLAGCAPRPVMTTTLTMDGVNTHILESTGTTSEAVYEDTAAGTKLTLRQDPAIYVDGVLENMWSGTVEFLNNMVGQTKTEVRANN